MLAFAVALLSQATKSDGLGYVYISFGGSLTSVALLLLLGGVKSRLAKR